MKIIAHRGAWSGDVNLGVPPVEKNSEDAFRIAIQYDFGIETDFRDVYGSVVISHNPPNEEAMLAEDFFKMVKPGQILAVNVKSDGLAHVLKSLWLKYAPTCVPFAFDMSVPDTLGYVREGFPFFERRSEYEKDSVWESARGTWLDGFHSIWFDLCDIDNILKLRKPVCIVSPELHGRDYAPFWNQLASYVEHNSEKSEDIWLCTDKPFEADRFFNHRK